MCQDLVFSGPVHSGRTGPRASYPRSVSSPGRAVLRAAFSHSGASAFCGARPFLLGAGRPGPIPPAARGESLGKTLELAAKPLPPALRQLPPAFSHGELRGACGDGGSK